MRSQPKQNLESVLPEGLLVDRNWLKNKHINRPLVDYYRRSGALEAVAHGIYRRPGPPLKWQHVVYSLTILGYRVHVGGRSALELQGFAHYLSMGGEGMRGIVLYGADKLPPWFDKLESPYRFLHRKQKLFVATPEEALLTIPFGHWDWPIPHATPELALLEYLAELKNVADFEIADKFFEGATSLRPGLLQLLLEQCEHVRVKRLFLWFAERHAYPWFSKLNANNIDLGSGKRVIVQNGALDAKYLITVPREMVHGSEQSLF